MGTDSFCRIREHRVRGYAAITLENESIAATFLPEKGTDLYALVAKHLGIDLLWKSPWSPKQAPSALAMAEPGSEAAWLDQYLGGWQWIFPNGGDACTYRGTRFGFHGEASVRSWDYNVVQDHLNAVEIEFTLSTSRGPFQVSRRIRLESNRCALLFDETIANRGAEDHYFMWGHHPAFGEPFLDENCRLTIPAWQFIAHDAEISPHQRVAPGLCGPWPLLVGKQGEPVDLSIVPRRDNRITEFGYVVELDAGWYALQNDRLGLGFGLAWPKEIFPYVWYWMELRGSFGYPWYGSSYVGAVEPFTSIPGSGLAKAIEQSSAPLLKAGEQVRAQLAAVLFPAGEVQAITNDGTVTMQTT